MRSMILISCAFIGLLKGIKSENSLVLTSSKVMPSLLLKNFCILGIMLITPMEPVIVDGEATILSAPQAI